MNNYTIAQDEHQKNIIIVVGDSFSVHGAENLEAALLMIGTGKDFLDVKNNFCEDCGNFTYSPDLKPDRKCGCLKRIGGEHG